ncbi:MAG TPA: class I SAM-dependent methyltransferase [Burkholderiales bacterium]|nr:class I SAM-dependent methyltransferase [Burkholderiales bacterium]
MNTADAALGPLTMEYLERVAPAELDGYRLRVSGVPYESKGILYSEMFFLYLCARAVGAKRILESGRARGQSTLLLSACFPDRPIISIEHDQRSPDVAIAAARLAGRGNVELRFGDATQMLPRIAQAGDVVLIDGPKGYRGLRLALRLLSQGRAPLVFLHDIDRRSPERRLVEARLPDTLYSDDPRFARLAHALDAAARDTIPVERRWSDAGAPGSYGYTLACLQRVPNASYRMAWLASVLDGVLRRATG